MNNKFINACDNGNLIEAQTYYTDININKGFEHACKYGHLNIVQWLHSLDDNMDNDRYEIGLMWACRYGHLEMVKWLLSLGVDNYDITEGLRLACINNHLNIVKLMYSLGIDITHDYVEGSPFLLACSYNNLEMAQWLQSIGADIHANREEAFNSACYNEHLEIVQWLWQFEINLVFIHTIPSEKILTKIFQLNENEIKLFTAAIELDYEKIKELIEAGINYTILDHFIFKKSCYQNAIDIVEYLSNCDDRYFFILRDKKIINYGIAKYPKNAMNL